MLHRSLGHDEIRQVGTQRTGPTPGHLDCHESQPAPPAARRTTSWTGSHTSNQVLQQTNRSHGNPTAGCNLRDVDKPGDKGVLMSVTGDRVHLTAQPEGGSDRREQAVASCCCSSRMGATVEGPEK